jgi:hypothetical protein
MKNLAFVLLLLAVGIVGVGLNRGWFSVNQKKIEQDEKTAKAEMHDLEETVKEKAADIKSSIKNRD